MTKDEWLSFPAGVRPMKQTNTVELKSLAQAQEFVAGIAASDTGLGGYLAMNPIAQQSLAYMFFQFANPPGSLKELTDLVATDKDTNSSPTNPPQEQFNDKRSK